MLVAYAVSPEGLSEAKIRRLCRLWYEWNLERPSGVGKLRLEGNCLLLRGQTRVKDARGANWLAQRLRKLSEYFPDCPCYLSGGDTLPMTILKGGEFQLFREVYEEARTA